ncbi:hypothetical protein HA402_010820 [Bradysia odoriphaga]|nr:hypothetical protein HA402_010820 [Bradysia odoriphaga]
MLRFDAVCGLMTYRRKDSWRRRPSVIDQRTYPCAHNNCQSQNVTEDEYGGSEEASSRKGRFRVTSSSSSGPPETTPGRYRLNPQNQFQSTSPCLQRGRFAVIPEEPHGSTASGSQSNEQSRPNNRSPSPDWDFDTDVSKLI